MTCSSVKLPGGASAIVCGPRRRSRTCPACGCITAPARQRLCDYPVGRGKTCDKMICERCAKNIGPDRDYCPEHAREAPAPDGPAR